MKRSLAVLFMLLLPLTGCTEEDHTAEDILQRYESVKNCSMEAVVRCEYENESREYTLHCDYEADGKSSVTVLKPSALQGLSVTYDGADSALIYEDLILNAGTLGSGCLSPAEVLPRLMDAIKNGWFLEEESVERDGKPLRQMTFEVEENGVKQYWTVLFDEQTGAPVAAELTEESQLFFTMEFTNFSFNDIIIENAN